MQKHPGLSLVLLVFLVFLSLIQARAADNILANPSFQNPDVNGIPDSWELYMPDPSSAAPARADASMFSLDKTIFKEQSPSIKLSSDQVVRMGVEQELLPMIAGQKLHVKVWMKGEKLDVTANSGAWVRLGLSNKGNADLQKKAYAASLFLKSPSPTFDWQLLEGDVVIPAEANSMDFACFLWNSKGTAWFESPSVEVIDGPPNPPGSIADPNDLAKYQQADAQLGPPAEDKPRVVFMGDSITEKWRLSTSFPQEHDFINRGISGQKTYQMLARFQQDALALKPKVVWFLGGTNDLAGNEPLEWITNNIKSMIELCKQNNIHIIVTSILPVSDYHAGTNPALKRTTDRPPDRILELNKELADLCQTEGVTYLDLHSKLVDASGQMPAELADDGLHPTAKGYAIIAPAVADAIHAELAK